MKPVNPLPDSILSLSGATADRLLNLNDVDAVFLYLHLLRRGGAPLSGWDPARTQAAHDTLARAGLAVSTPAPDARRDAPEPEPPEYTSGDITNALNSQRDFAGLADEIERLLGKKLSTADLKTLYTLYDFLALPPEVILLAATWCAQEIARKYGAGRKPVLSQIRREAFSWARQGVDTVEAAEEHLRRLLRLRSREGEIVRLLELPDRPLVERERSYINTWVEMGFDNNALRLAYEKTVMGTAGKCMDWRYMNGILRRWHEKGLHTVAQVSGVESAPRRTSRPAAGPDRQGREDMERIRRMMQQMKQEQGG